MGGFTPYEKCNMLCINRLQFHPLYIVREGGAQARAGRGVGRMTKARSAERMTQARARK